MRLTGYFFYIVMTFWLIQSCDAHPGLAVGMVPAGLLSATEEYRFTTLKTCKRRRDWLLGRWTAKHLVQAVIKQKTGELIPLTRLIIQNAPNGVPYLAYQYPLNLSISHSEGRAFCAVVPLEDYSIGADIEMIRPRPAGFAKEYFTNSEITQVSQALPEVRDLLMTAIWSAKEAVLKSFHVGLTVNLFSVCCWFKPIRTTYPSWSMFEARFDPNYLKSNSNAIKLNERIFEKTIAVKGWWLTVGSFILTLVVHNQKIHFLPKKTPHPENLFIG